MLKQLGSSTTMMGEIVGRVMGIHGLYSLGSHKNAFKFAGASVYLLKG